LDLSLLQTLVLDEADRMLDMGFQESLDTIISYCPPARQSLLFSATFPKEIQSMAKRVLKDPELVKVEATKEENKIDDVFYRINHLSDKNEALKTLLLHTKPESCLVFCNTKVASTDVCAYLKSEGFSALALNGDFEQKTRTQTLIRFENGSCSILVATDVAARGLDIDELDLVINYDLAHDPEVHVHRIGRTGRAGKSGKAFSLFVDREASKLVAIEDLPQITIKESKIPQIRDTSIKRPEFSTVQIDAGKKNKIRPGDVLGALTATDTLTRDDVGKIKVISNWTFVAIKRNSVKAALKALGEGKIKGRNYRVRELR
jgi:ATP-independent RNA helicase DbpA